MPNYPIFYTNQLKSFLVLSYSMADRSIQLIELIGWYLNKNIFLDYVIHMTSSNYSSRSLAKLFF